MQDCGVEHGARRIGFSIPRDDWVTFPQTYDGQHTGKIDQAYGDALAEKESEVRQQHPNMSQSQVAFQGNEAGRAATVATVESFTGVHIDHFAEINLDGFYELARVLGGVRKLDVQLTVVDPPTQRPWRMVMPLSRVCRPADSW